MKEKSILLLSHGHFESECLEFIKLNLKREFHYLTEIKECYEDLNKFYNPSRRQYDANEIIKYLEVFSDPQHVKIMGLFRVDLYIPILTYIFGQAIFKGKTGIVSGYRLRNEQYGMSPNQELLVERLNKTVLHEIGHSFGLIHCHDPFCIMRSSTYVEDIDQKGTSFCPSCRTELDTLI